MTKTSVVIISKDEPALAETLAALGDPHPGGPGPDEIVVVDASDGRLDDIRDGYPAVRWVPFERSGCRRTSIAAQRNVGIAEAAGDVIVFIDCGCIPAPGWLEELVEPLQTTELVCVGPALSARPSIYDAAERARVAAAPRYVSAAPTINFAARRSALVDVGGFDETFAYGSDIDLCWRLGIAGVRIRYVADAVVVSDWGDGHRQLRRSFAYGRARTRLYRKHPRRIPGVVRDDPIVVAYPLFLAGLPFAARRPRTLLGYVALLGIPWWRNRDRHPVRTIVDHLVQGAGVLTELSVGFRRS